MMSPRPFTSSSFLTLFRFPGIGFLALAVLVPSLLQAAPSSFAFGPDGAWVVVHENRGRWGCQGKRLPAELADRIEQVSNNETILGVGLNQHSWIVIGSKSYWSNNIPAGLADYLKSQTNQGRQIIDVALTRQGNWVALSRKGNWYWWQSSGGDVPQDLLDYMHQANNKNYSVIGVGISPDGGWSACYRTPHSVSYRMKNVIREAADYVDTLHR